MTSVPHEPQLDVPVDDYVVHLHRYGTKNAAPVLFLHGTGPGATGWESFRPILPFLAQYDCLIPDLIGFGDSSHPEPPPAGPGPWLDLRAATTLRLIDALNLGPVDLIGHSYGGRLALELLTRKPDMFGKVVLIAAGGTPIKPTLQRLTGFYDNPTAAGIRDFVASQLHPGSALPPGIDSYLSARLSTALRPEVKRSFQASMGAGDPAPVYDSAVLGAIAQDTLVIHGKGDGTIPVDGSMYLAQHLPHADLHVFGRAGHLVQFEVAAQIGTMISIFLQGSSH
ncbi:MULTISPECIES: alpha/beta fold hydrolase [unclassified Mycolicibacterium]|uniref:alpha/beta fold hydrolase n=1 Tax=unclassified Mycolicibacterium TaxID=2636767 RepID=UPI002EDBA1B9